MRQIVCGIQMREDGLFKLLESVSLSQPLSSLFRID
jgi:hypothetical protein